MSEQIPEPVKQDDSSWQWVIIELAGHQKVVGRYFDLGVLHRVDIPDEEKGFLRTIAVGDKFIFRLNYVDEATARRMATQVDMPVPIAFSMEMELQRRLQKLPMGDVLEGRPEDWQDEEYADQV